MVLSSAKADAIVDVRAGGVLAAAALRLAVLACFGGRCRIDAG
jgi:hypothetical protein